MSLEGLGYGLLGLLGAALVVLLVLRVRLPAEARAAARAWLGAQRALMRARRRSEAAIRRARLGVWRAERRHSSAIAALDRRIVELEDPRGKRIATFDSVLLHEFRIITPAGESGLDEVRATVDTAGNLSETKRATLTRLGLGGLVLGPLGAVLALGFQKRRTVDHRELYLLIEAGPASCVLQIEPDAGAQVRAFATRINAVAAGVAHARERRAAESAAMRTRLASTREDVSDLEQARAQLVAARNDDRLRAAISTAEAAVARARQEWERATVH
jgi:hypothetical protein